jgi:hypothetical protein
MLIHMVQAPKHRPTNDPACWVELGRRSRSARRPLAQPPMGTPRIEVGDVFVQAARQMPLVDEVAPLIRWFGVLVFLFLAASAGAATIPATSCSDAHVQSAINTAAAGDTVTVPAGNCTWTTTVTITSKRLVLQGAGINVTTITDQATGATRSPSRGRRRRTSCASRGSRSSRAPAIPME